MMHVNVHISFETFNDKTKDTVHVCIKYIEELNMPRKYPYLKSRQRLYVCFMENIDIFYSMELK